MKYLDAEVNRLDKVEVGKDGRGGDGRELLNVIKIVRTRVCAQMDLMMGEDIAILTRMLSYEDRYMMKATLRAGKGGIEGQVLGSRRMKMVPLVAYLVCVLMGE